MAPPKFRLRQVKTTMDYVVGQDEVSVKPATLERKDIQPGRFSMVVGTHTHLNDMFASQYQSIDWTQHTTCKLQVVFIHLCGCLLMRPNEGRNSCPGLGCFSFRIPYVHECHENHHMAEMFLTPDKIIRNGSFQAGWLKITEFPPTRYNDLTYT